MSLFLAGVLIMSYLDFINQALCYLSGLIFYLSGKALKATQSYFEHKEATHGYPYRHKGLLALQGSGC